MEKEHIGLSTTALAVATAGCASTLVGDDAIAVRAHGNTLEQSMLYSALALSCIATPGVPPVTLAGGAGVFVAARLLHAAAIFSRQLLLRQAAHVVSVLVHLSLVTVIGWAWVHQS